jgi:hypothetical protein
VRIYRALGRRTCRGHLLGGIAFITSSWTPDEGGENTAQREGQVETTESAAGEEWGTPSLRNRAKYVLRAEAEARPVETRFPCSSLASLRAVPNRVSLAHDQRT